MKLEKIKSFLRSGIVDKLDRILKEKFQQNTKPEFCMLSEQISHRKYLTFPQELRTQFFQYFFLYVII